MTTLPLISMSLVILLHLIISVNSIKVIPREISKTLPYMASKQVKDSFNITKTLYVSFVCPPSGSCRDEISEIKPPVTVAYEACTSKCLVISSCGANRAEGCETIRDSAGKWRSTCRLRKCFDSVYEGKPSKCCTREICVRPSTCTVVPASTPHPVILPLHSSETIDLRSVLSDATFLIKQSLSIPDLSEDIYLLTDATGGMLSIIKLIKRNVVGLIIKRRARVNDLRMGVGIYRDEFDLTNGFQNVLGLVDMSSSSNLALLQSKVNGIHAFGGRDRAEAGLAALYKVATDSSIGWRSNARKVIVLLGDAPQHEPTCVDGKVITRADVIRELRAKDITLVSIDTYRLNDPPGSSFTCSRRYVHTSTPGNQMLDISVATKGKHFRIRPTDDFSKMFDFPLDNLKLQLNVDVANCAKVYDIRFNIFVPLVVKRGEKVTFEQTIKYKRSACSASVSKNCNLLFSASGPLLGTQTLLAQKILGCP